MIEQLVRIMVHINQLHEPMYLNVRNILNIKTVH